MADRLYQRQLLLHTNAYPEIYPLNVRVKTAPLWIYKRKIPYLELVCAFLIYAIASAMLTGFISAVITGLIAVPSLLEVIMGLVWALSGAFIGALTGATFGLFLEAMISLTIGDFFSDSSVVIEKWTKVIRIGVLIIGAVFGIRIAIGMSGLAIKTVSEIAIVIGIGTWLIIVSSTTMLSITEIKRDRSTLLPFLFTGGLATSFGIGCIVGLLHPYILLALAGTGLSLARVLLYSPFKRRRLMTKYHQSQERLIRP